MRFSGKEKKILELWFLSCEDLQIPNGGCGKCEFRDKCEEIRIKIFGDRNRDKFKFEDNSL